MVATAGAVLTISPGSSPAQTETSVLEIVPTVVISFS